MILVLLACSGGHGDAALTPATPVYVEARKVASGSPIRVHAPDDATVTVTGDQPVQDAGEGVWEIPAKNGSYIVSVQQKDTKDPVNLYVDVGVDGPTGGPMEDLAALPPPPPPMWPYVVAGVAGVALLAGGIYAARRLLVKPAPPPPPEPADVRARREWRELRGRTDLHPEELARQLCEVYKRYVEAVHGWPATQRTTREILDNLAGEYTAAQLDHARHLLMAMDLVKFAERDAHDEIFESLDRDFQLLVVRRA